MNAPLKIGSMILVTMGCFTSGPAQPADSVVIRVGKESKVIFFIKDKRDLETLKHYNFQALMDDMVQKLEKRDTTALTKPSTEYLKDSTQIKSERTDTALQRLDNWARDQDQDEDYRRERREKRWNRRTYHSFNIDVGMNNYLENGKFPDDGNKLYSIKPWGSWYVGLNSVLRTRIAGKFFVEWGAGVTWYNFKFNNRKVVISKDDTGVIFSEDPRALNFKKSKLTATYVNLSIVPMLDFGGYGRKPMVFNGDRVNFDKRGSFRIGFGPYAGYRIDSYTKTVYDDGDTRKTHSHDNYYLNNLRYGLRLQLGFRDTDIFFNYDMNDLFTEGKGPRLHAFSFGITL